MKLWQEIFANILREGGIAVSFPQAPSLTELFDSACYKALCEIKEVIEDDALDDKECFERIEKIIRVFEKMGSSCGTRHDF